MRAWLYPFAAAFAVSSACAVDDGGPPLLRSEAPAPCDLHSRSYRIDSLDVPASAREAEAFGLDLDFDGRVDNAGGVVLATLGRRDPDEAPRLHESLQRALDDGTLTWLVHVDTCGDHARIELTGTGRLGVSSAAVGTIDGAGRVAVAEGIGLVPVSSLFEPEGSDLPVVWAPGMGLTFDGHASEDAVMGRLGIGISATVLSAQSTRDAFARAVLVPDLDLAARHQGKPVYWPHHDGDRDHMSLGLGFHATRI